MQGGVSPKLPRRMDTVHGGALLCSVRTKADPKPTRAMAHDCSSPQFWFVEIRGCSRSQDVLHSTKVVNPQSLSGCGKFMTPVCAHFSIRLRLWTHGSHHQHPMHSRSSIRTVSDTRRMLLIIIIDKCERIYPIAGSVGPPR
jgi:hypothetical protein